MQQLICSNRKIDLSRPPVMMGVLNVTPDSFSDGGRYLEPAEAVTKGLSLLKDGAAILDIGGESTRPGSRSVEPEEQISRVLPVIEGILKKKSKAIISIDTTRSKVAEAALSAGAVIVNDVSALREDPEMARVCKEHRAGVVLMHMQGNPETMQKKPLYVDVIRQVMDFLTERISFARQVGINPESIIADVGIGFGKTLNHNLILIRELSQFHRLEVPLLVGASRKSFIGQVLGIEDPNERLMGTAAAMAWCVAANVQIMRVHDVRQMTQVGKVINAIGAGRVL